MVIMSDISNILTSGPLVIFIEQNNNQYYLVEKFFLKIYLIILFGP